MKAKWLAIGKVHTTRWSRPSALYADMKSAWNLRKEAILRNLADNVFTVQFGCLGYWNNKAMLMGRWMLRNN
jgi:hypothetical protein